MSHAAYLAAEAASELRHEFLEGEVYVMAVGTPEHSALAAVRNALAAARSTPVAARSTPAAARRKPVRVRKGLIAVARLPALEKKVSVREN